MFIVTKGKLYKYKIRFSSNNDIGEWWSEEVRTFTFKRAKEVKKYFDNRIQGKAYISKINE